MVLAIVNQYLSEEWINFLPFSPCYLAVLCVCMVYIADGIFENNV